MIVCKMRVQNVCFNSSQVCPKGMKRVAVPIDGSSLDLMTQQMFVTNDDDLGRFYICPSRLFLFELTNCFFIDEGIHFPFVSAVEKNAFLETKPSVRYQSAIGFQHGCHHFFGKGMNMGFYKSQKQDTFSQLVLRGFTECIKIQNLPIKVVFAKRALSYELHHHYTGGGISEDVISSLLHSSLLGMLFLPSESYLNNGMAGLLMSTFDLTMDNLAAFCQVENFAGAIMPCVSNYFDEHAIVEHFIVGYRGIGLMAYAKKTQISTSHNTKMLTNYHFF